ncbi:transferrin-binding protein-like solute binding protein [Neisseria meningitidis]|uniref:transferrin-binding protein-like solute binding protein n=1 Tax=Neisseria meningitidis TaxID=487 RepID=UPI000E59231E|nr:transferrin-binding protein-like solute binding protein [Neisseria meningitidis]MBG8596291.1 transferrin-binding protein-like solute binding protein [Neisseria meningitidis]MBG8854756.1 transferrin-binding protein-like solute binding protein [Neisseria meningitidis]MBJ1819255.1 transferrin-binding protein-like solute binding protein [Neisseria meningitidis]MBJ1823346.1 transferrin-binding protein-like solute binding protein [Neisseria meningitidis]MBJ7758150.1 transferrin-binding protein-li
MNNPLVNQAAMVLPVFLLSACLGGGGSFDLDSVDTEAPRPAPKYQDVSSEKPKAQKDQGGYGFAMRFKRRNWHPRVNPKEDKIELSENDWEQTDNGNIKTPSKQKNIINALLGSEGALLQDSSQEGQSISKVTDHHNFQYVWSGFFYKHIQTKFETTGGKMTVRSGPDGYIFYKGKDPSRKLPVSGEVMYKGTWDFLTDVKANQKFTDLGNASTKPGDRYSAFSGELDYIVKQENDKKDGHVGLGLTTEITVDFEKKTLSGKLIKNNSVITTNNDKHTTQYYSLEATLKGNRFNGKATATDKPKENETKQHPFVSDSSSLSGGFFGPQGEELGFRFLSDDKKVAVVGSAKTKDKPGNGAAAPGGTDAAASNGAAGTPSESTKLTTVLDAVELKSGGKEVKNLDNFSNAAQLVVDGIMIPLLPKDSESGNTQADKGKNGGTEFTRKFDHTPESDKKDAQAGTQTNGAQTASNTAGDTNGKTKTYEVEVCCSNLNYLKYGMLTRKNSKSAMQAGKSSSQTDAKTEQVEQSMFLQGERTDEKEIPNDQNVVYRGSWYGHIANDTSWSGNASDREGGNRADFTVNFGTKKINGTLTAENRQQATFTIEGDIKDNGFEGTAKTADSGFDLDQSNNTRTPKAYITDAKVQGGFYGPKAEELGGWFAYSSDKQTKNAPDASGNGNSASSATVVFGAKRQQPVQ